MISRRGSKTIFVFRTTGRCMRMSAWTNSHAWFLFAIGIVLRWEQELLAWRGDWGCLSYRSGRGLLEFRRRDYRCVHDLGGLGFCQKLNSCHEEVIKGAGFLQSLCRARANLGMQWANRDFVLDRFFTHNRFWAKTPEL